VKHVVVSQQPDREAAVLIRIIEIEIQSDPFLIAELAEETLLEGEINLRRCAAGAKPINLFVMVEAGPWPNQVVTGPAVNEAIEGNGICGGCDEKLVPGFDDSRYDYDRDLRLQRDAL
jgi:hypothetical protein